MIKAINKIGMEGMYLNILKTIYNDAIARVILTVKG